MNYRQDLYLIKYHLNMNILIFSSQFVHVLLARILQNIENIYFCGNNDTFLEISKLLPL